jgi:hypothetical protein
MGCDVRDYVYGNGDEDSKLMSRESMKRGEMAVRVGIVKREGEEWAECTALELETEILICSV